jgi:GDP-L-fucose synthase
VIAALLRRFYEAKQSDAKSVTCWGSGLPRREFLHVDDLAAAAVFCLENWNPSNRDSPKNQNGEPLHYLNVGSGIELTIKELALLIAHTVGFKGLIEWDSSKPDGTMRKLLDGSQLQNLGWNASISLTEGLSAVVNTFPEALSFKKSSLKTLY